MDDTELFPNGSSLIVKSWWKRKRENSDLSFEDYEQQWRMMSQSDEEPPEYLNFPENINLVKGDQLDLVGLLGGNTLVRNDDNHESIDISRLRGKYVIILCVFLPIRIEDEDVSHLRALQASWSKWRVDRSRSVELIIVHKIKQRIQSHSLPHVDDVIFQQFLSAFPRCLHLPSHDPITWERVGMTLGLGSQYPPCSALLILDPHHRVLQTSFSLLSSFGSASYPFTDERQYVLREDLFNIPVTLERLLNTPYLLSYKNKMIRKLFTLNTHLVGLYLCCNGFHLETIINTWRTCHSMGRDLEIVVVYVPEFDNPDTFIDFVNDMIGDLNWWILPFDDAISRRLRSICVGCDDLDYNIVDRLIMVGPGGNFLEPNGLKIIESATGDAYPFSLKVLVEEETQRLKDLTLESLLVLSEDSNFLVSNTGERVLIDDLMGKDVLVNFVDVLPPPPHDFAFDDGLLELMTGIYKGKEEYDFEVVFILLHSEIREIPADWFSRVPGLCCPPNSDRENHILRHLYPRGVYEHDVLVAFGSDGHIVSLNPLRRLQQYGAKAFPIPDTLVEDLTHMYNTCLGIGLL